MLPREALINNLIPKGAVRGSDIVSPISVLKDLFESNGSAYYDSEAVNQLQHALQTACLAESDGASRELIAAALLHDVGHLLGAGDEGLAGRGVDARHEVSGARYLSEWFETAVTEPIRLHVQAKSYLCHVEAGYYESLSQASKDSLQVQGGIFDDQGAQSFLNRDHHRDAIRLRRWDDKAKDPHAGTPPLDYYLSIVAEVIRD